MASKVSPLLFLQQARADSSRDLMANSALQCVKFNFKMSTLRDFIPLQRCCAPNQKDILQRKQDFKKFSTLERRKTF